MIGIVSKILGSDKIISKGLDLIDSMHTSDEELIAIQNKSRIDMLNAYAPFKVAQRFLALMFSGTFLLSFFLVLIMTLMGIGDTSQVRDVVSEFYIGEILLLIVGFYFGGGLAESIKRKDSK